MSRELRHWFDERPFVEVVEPFLAGCPGPFLAAKGLRHMAYQRIEGIPSLDSADMEGSRPGQSRALGRRRYSASVVEIARQLRVRAGYLSQSAFRRGYRYSRALRWIRFLHGIALYEQGIRNDHLARRLGFSDPSGWTRFVRALIGTVPSKLPCLPLAAWVERAIEDVYGTVSGGRGTPLPATPGFSSLRDDSETRRRVLRPRLTQRSE